MISFYLYGQGSAFRTSLMTSHAAVHLRGFFFPCVLLDGQHLEFRQVVAKPNLDDVPFLYLNRSFGYLTVY